MVLRGFYQCAKITGGIFGNGLDFRFLIIISNFNNFLWNFWDVQMQGC